MLGDDSKEEGSGILNHILEGLRKTRTGINMKRFTLNCSITQKRRSSLFLVKLKSVMKLLSGFAKLQPLFPHC